MTTTALGATGALGSLTAEEAVEESLGKIRKQLFDRGVKGVAGLGRVFKRADFNGNKKMDKVEFDDVLSMCGVFLGKQEISMLFRHLDRDGSGQVDYDEFLRGIAGSMNERRKAVVLRAFESMDKDGSGLLNLADVSGVYNVSKHPEVMEGKKTADEVLTEFLSGFEGHSGTAGDGTVTMAEFMDYYGDLSASIPLDDYFVAMIENAFGIMAGEDKAADEACDRFEEMLRAKAMEKSKSRGGSARREVQAAFNFFDKDGTGAVTVDEFGAAMLQYGIPLERRMMQHIFKRYDADGSGTVSSDEFCSRVFGESRT